jgi:DNA-binding NtrC family response regulator
MGSISPIPMRAGTDLSAAGNPPVSFPVDASVGAAARVQPRHDANLVAIDELGRGARTIAGAIVRSESMSDAFATVSRLAKYAVTVLIHGESGTGKELVARALHDLGTRASGPFVTFNCSNLMSSLAESQLFGHVKGAFTDAREDSKGYFRAAEGGTLFLDEIGELPLELQPKLLRVLETHEVQAVGSPRTHKVNVRVVAATNRDLRAMVKAGQFRDDLFYRLNAAAITVAPLRDRPADISALLAHFIAHFNAKFGKRIEWVSRAVLEAMVRYDWPGNVRELANAVQSAVLLTDGDVLESVQLGDESTANTRDEEVSGAVAAAPVQAAADSPVDYSLDAAIRRSTFEALVRALRATRGNRGAAAQMLGISRFTIYRMIARFELNKSNWWSDRSAGSRLATNV